MDVSGRTYGSLWQFIVVCGCFFANEGFIDQGFRELSGYIMGHSVPVI